MANSLFSKSNRDIIELYRALTSTVMVDYILFDRQLQISKSAATPGQYPAPGTASTTAASTKPSTPSNYSTATADNKTNSAAVKTSAGVNPKQQPLTAGVSAPISKDAQTAFYHKVRNIGVDFYNQGYPINPDVMAAQVCLETGWGTSKMAREANNYVGMRAYKPDYSTPEKYYWRKNNEAGKSEPFAKYDDPADSLKTYAELFKRHSVATSPYPNYYKATLLKDDPIACITALAPTYAPKSENKDYDRKVIAIIKSRNPAALNPTIG